LIDIRTPVITPCSICRPIAARDPSFLTENGVEQGGYRFCMKWLRYYLDFCTKYSFEWSKNDSMSAFLINLQNKNQWPLMLDQAKIPLGF
jgi:hypothetical protein